MSEELLARGRAADVFAAGPGRVLRRYREGEPHDAAVEAAVMEHARAHGFPVPEVYDAGGRDLVMARVDGPTMLADLSRRPWRVRAHGRTLADPHAGCTRSRRRTDCAARWAAASTWCISTSIRTTS
jgi:Phosphotransferase enzyme family